MVGPLRPVVPLREADIAITIVDGPDGADRILSATFTLRERRANE